MDLAIYSAVLSSLNFVLLIVITLGASLLFRRYHRQQQGSSFSEGAHRKENNGRVVGRHEDSSGRAIDGLLPLLTSSRETAEEVTTPVSPTPIEDQVGQEEPRGNQNRSKPRVPKPYKAREGQADSMGAAAGKVKRAFSMPRVSSKPATEPKPAGHAKSMKMITYELNKTEKFQRASAESEELQEPADQNVSDACETNGARPNPVLGVSGGISTRKGNEYQMTVLINDEASKDTFTDQKNDPYYFKIQQEEFLTDDGEAEDGCGGMRERRSMSDTTYLHESPYSFPLKKTDDKKRDAGAKKQKPSAKPKPLPPTSKASPEYPDIDNEYEDVNHQSGLDQGHSVVVPAEPKGEYSRLNRKPNKDKGEPVSCEGYDHLDMGETGRKSPAPINQLKI